MAAAARLDSSTTEGLQELEELTAFLLSPGLPSDIPDHPVGDCAPSAALQWHHGEVEPVIEMPSPSGSREDCLAAEFPKEAAWGIALGSAGGAGCSPSVQPLAITQGVECGQVVPSSPEQFPRKRRRSTPGMPALETGTSGSQASTWSSEADMPQSLPNLAGVRSGDHSSPGSPMPATRAYQQALSRALPPFRTPYGQAAIPTSQGALELAGLGTAQARGGARVVEHPTVSMPVDRQPKQHEEKGLARRPRGKSPPSQPSNDSQQAEELRIEALPAEAIRSINTPHTTEMARVLDGLTQSSSSAERLAALHRVNGLRGIMGNSATALRMRHLQEILPHPGWNTVVPAPGGILRIYRALEEGSQDTPVRLTLTAHQKITNLGQILRVPIEQRIGIMKNMAGRIVQAKQSSRMPGDEHSVQALHLAGEALHGHSMTAASPTNFVPNWDRVKGQLQLNSHQISASKVVWKRISTTLAEVQAERAQLLSGIMAGSAVQQECIGHEAQSTAVRLVLFSICTPETTQRCVCGFYPLFVDWLGLLKHMAEDD
ncbi:hypothetical protein WJX84_004082 [Apatococcus fuscideae]|uniref:Uncharacterized protein n=1 Tax=Apatococcus fuscideae TaxID=2026836 RepID=A0AAW1TAQ3_9CHLO